MKTLGRTFIILIAAGLIALGWYAFSATAASQSVEPARPAEVSQTSGSTADQTLTTESGEDVPTRPEGSDMGFSLARVFTGMAANVGVTALVIVLIVWLRKLINKFPASRFKFV